MFDPFGLKAKKKELDEAKAFFEERLNSLIEERGKPRETASSTDMQELALRDKPLTGLKRGDILHEELAIGGGAAFGFKRPIVFLRYLTKAEAAELNKSDDGKLDKFVNHDAAVLHEISEQARKVSYIDTRHFRLDGQPFETRKRPTPDNKPRKPRAPKAAAETDTPSVKKPRKPRAPKVS